MDSLDQYLNAHPKQGNSMLLEPGTMAGEWGIVALIGRGGSGEVYRAENSRLGTVAAVKVLANDSEIARRRFEREARLFAKNASSAFPHYYGSGEVRGRPFFAIELLEPYDPPSRDRDVARYLLEVCEGVAILHHSGFIHRDIKPQNIMRRADGSAVLIDFGLVKDTAIAPGQKGSSLSIVDGHTVGLGTPGYAAPEQLIGGDVSPAADIHALGIFADACFGDRPPRAWVRIIRRATCSLPNQRYATVEAFAAAVRRRRLPAAAVGAACSICAAAIAAFGLRAIAQSLPEPPPPDPVNYYVDAANGSDSADGLARQAAKKTIQSALDAASPGDIVTVADGEYHEAAQIAKPLLLVSASGPEKTTIRGFPLKSVISILPSGSNAVVRGSCLTGGTGTKRKGTETYYGGGVYCDYSSATIRNCIIRGNGAGPAKSGSAAFGGGLQVRKGVLGASNCLIVGNYAWACGGGAIAESGGVMDLSSCTVAGNTSTDFFGHQGGLGIAEKGALSAMNSIVWGNSGDQIGAFAWPYNKNTKCAYAFCNVQGGISACGIEMFSAENNNISRDPLFADAAKGDYRLMPGSPCIDIGNFKAQAASGETDLIGNPRLSGRLPDLGCYEAPVSAQSSR